MLLLILAGSLSAWSGIAHAEEALRILFVGNSQTYTANLPAVLQAVAGSGGRRVVADMLVKGGATLSDRQRDGSVERALGLRRYDWVVLQERGGDALCHGPGRTRCDAMAGAVKALAAAARNAHAKPLLLGTYQPGPEASRRLQQEEAAIAAAASMPYVPLSEALRKGRQIAPDLSWFAEDGMHPGPDLALLAALLLHAEMFGDVPALAGLRVEAPGYSPRARFFPPLLADEKSEQRGDAPHPRYSAATTDRLAAMARAESLGARTGPASGEPIR